MKRYLTLAWTLSLLTHLHAATPAPSKTAVPPQDPNPSARYGIKDKSNVFLTGEIIWFKPLVNELAKKYSTTSSDTVQAFQNVFKPSVRVAIGYNTSYDGWDAVLSYTGMRYKHNNPFVDLQNEETTLSGTTSFVYYLDQGDLDCGRMYKVSKHLKLRPSAGIRALWLTEKNTVDFVNSSTDLTSEVISRFKNTLVGLTGALNSTWMFSSGFSMYANLGLCALVNSQKLVYSDKDLDTNTYNKKTNSPYSSKIINGLDLAIGLRWDKNFSDDSYHFSLNAGYEHHSLINLNYNLNLKNQPQFGFSDQDFTLQGIALGARFDF